MSNEQIIAFLQNWQEHGIKADRISYDKACYIAELFAQIAERRGLLDIFYQIGF